ncbi:MAG: radical SAM protein [Candidatus Hodarchaeales archaeon]
MRAEYETVQSKSKIINHYDQPDSWFWVKGSVNPFRGCEHDCKYCDGKAEWYRITNFGTHIQIKSDAPQKYENELLKLGFNPHYRPRRETLEHFFPKVESKKNYKTDLPRFPFAIGGGVCDVYQAAEKRFKVTRQLLIKSRNFGIPVMILTKSKLVLRDLDLLMEINAINNASVSFSITLNDEKVRKIFEPTSTSTNLRFKSLKTIRKKKLHGGIMLMPILPGIGDTEENLISIIQKAKKSNTEFILHGGLTLKPGNNKREYFDVIKKHYPHLIPLYIDLYSNNNKFGVPDTRSKYKLNVHKLVHEYCRKLKIPDRMPRYIPSGVHRMNYLISTILLNLAYYYQWINEQPWKKILPFIQLAKIIESFSQNLSELPRDKIISRFEISNENLKSIIAEVLETGKSSDLSEFQDPETILTSN